jgi:hypothetical protein
MKVETFADQLFFTTLRARASNDQRRWGGTAFVYAVATDKGTAHFLITSRHVLADATEASFFEMEAARIRTCAIRAEARPLCNGSWPSPSPWD